VCDDIFRVVLNSPFRIYSPSDTITGYVVGWHATTQVQVVLEGRAKTSICKAKIQYKDQAPLLYECVQLKPTTNMGNPCFFITVFQRVAGDLEKLREHAPGDPSFNRYRTSDGLTSTRAIRKPSWASAATYYDQALPEFAGLRLGSHLATSSSRSAPNSIVPKAS